MIDRLILRLRDSRPPDDLPAEARARLPEAVAAQLFPAPLIPAAVLVALVEKREGWEILLTRRTERLRDHPGQISFPGGRVEAQDAGPAAAALREAREEIGVDPALVEVIGYLPPYPVVTGFAVSPVVGILRGVVRLQPDPTEVAEIFSVPLAYLLEPANVLSSERHVRGVTLAVYAYEYGPHHIWGATAQILHGLCELLYATD